MRAIIASGLHEQGDPVEVFSYDPKFEPAWLNTNDFTQCKIATPTTLVVRMQATSVNPADIKYVDGGFKRAPGHPLPRFPCSLGVDGSGIVVHVGPKVTKYKVGDAVLGLHQRMDEGAWAEYATFEEYELALRPPNMCPAVAAAIPVAALTAFLSFMCCSELQQFRKTPPVHAPMQRILVNGASGGVGSWIVFLAMRYFGIPTILATCSGTNAEYVKAVGATHVIDYRSQDVWQEVTKVCGEENPRPLDAVLDNVGGIPFLLKALQITKAMGDVVTVVPLADVADQSPVSALRFFAFLAKRKAISMFSSAAANMHFNGAMPHEGLMQRVADSVAALVPCTDPKTFPVRLTCAPLEDGLKSITVVASGRAVGKNILLISE